MLLPSEAPVLITVQELEVHRIVVSKTYAPGALDYHSAEFRQLGPLAVEAAAELVGSEIRIWGRLGTRLETCCDRCLAAVNLPLARDFDLFYRPIESIAREEEIEIPQKELDIGFYSGPGIQLADVVTEQVILSVPMKVICRPDCRGLCPNCGVNRNLEACHCSPAPGDSPFASLKGG